MLTEGEQILINAEQSRMMPGGSIATPNSIYVTNKRIIFRNPRMWGLKIDLMDYAYKDLANVELHKGIFTTEIELTPRFNSEKVKLPAVSKDVAEELFGAIRKGMHGDFGLGDVTGNVVVTTEIRRTHFKTRKTLSFERERPDFRQRVRGSKDETSE